MTHFFERYKYPNSDLAIYQAIGPDIASLGPETQTLLPGRDETPPGAKAAAGCYGVYAPGAAVDPAHPNRIVVVFEADPRESEPNGPFCPGQPTTTNEYISAMTSSDYGATWSNPHRIVAVSNAAGENVGTPSLIWLPKLSQWALYYHENVAGTVLKPHLRVYATGTDVSNLPYFDMPNCPPSKCSDTVLTVNGAGRADITQWVTGANGADDDRYYMVLETFSGSVLCNTAGDYDQMIIAATAAGAGPQGPYTVQGTPLAPKSMPACIAGPDLPTWYYTSQSGHGRYYIISNDNPTHDPGHGFTIQRWDLS